MADETTVEDQGIPAPEGTVDLIDTDYEIGQDNIQTKIGPFGLDIHNPVFVISGLVIIAFVAFALFAADTANALFNGVKQEDVEGCEA